MASAGVRSVLALDSGLFSMLLATVAPSCQFGNPGDASASGSTVNRDPATPTVSGSTSDAANEPDADADGHTCKSVIEEHPPVSFQHVVDCSPVSYDTNPPSGGDHYGTWAAFQFYDFPVPPGFLVHDLEHGAVVIWYNCSDGCPNEIAEAKAMIDALPSDDTCNGYPTARRVVLTPYPGLTARWAASSWGWTLRADCFDSAAFTSFYMDHFGRGREQACAAGAVILDDTCP